MLTLYKEKDNEKKEQSYTYHSFIKCMQYYFFICALYIKDYFPKGIQIPLLILRKF